jgi:DNA polymerase III epsilon subunit-like protein
MIVEGSASGSNEWVVVDFETASTRATPCQLAAVRFRDGVEHDVLLTHVHQPPDRFDAFNVALHGITPAAVAGAPPWPVVRDELVRFADGAPLVAHYAPYDLGVVRDACDLCQLEWPTIRYTCTVSIARMVWPGLASYSLLLLCSSLGIAVDHDLHHDALYDARLAAAVLQRAMAEKGASSLDDLLDRTWIRFGELGPDGWYGSSVRARMGIPEADLSADPSSPLYGKVVVFTGELAMVRRAAWLLVAEAGGQPEAGVTKRTHMLVCGYQDMLRLAAGQTKSAKLRKAEQLHAGGQPLEILTERDFFRMLEANRAAA